MPQRRKYANNAERQAAHRLRTEQAAKEQLDAKGLPPLPSIPTIPGYPRWKQDFAETQYRMERTRDEMRDYCDQRSEQWQESERAELMEQHIQIIEEVIEKLEGLQE